MQTSFTRFLFCVLLLTSSVCGYAQSNIITTIAGDGTSGFSGDGGPAAAARFNQLSRIAIDAAGNRYVSDCGNHRIRKITPSGIISTYAGNGTAAFSGDGGPATAASLNAPVGVAVDAAGNLYIADQLNYRIRKVSTSGTISTVVGNGTTYTTGDGGPATNAGLAQVGGVAVDGAGNIYTGDYWHRVRKVNTSGIINTIAGNGTSGSTGDGGPATAALLNDPWDLTTDATGNIYICEMSGQRVRKINAAGIISTLAGTGTLGYSGDGGPATAAQLSNPDGITVDQFGNVYVGSWATSAVRKISPSGIITTVAGTGVSGYSGDGGPATAAQMMAPRGLAFNAAGDLHIVDFDGWIRMFSALPAGVSDSFSAGQTVSCSEVNFDVNTLHYTAGSSIFTSFGDGSTASHSVVAGVTGTAGYTTFNHSYTTNGTYTVKHLLMIGSTAVDSISTSVTYTLCNTIAVRFYLDNNSDCAYQPATDNHIFQPITVEIDSNGTPVDSFVTPGGFNYTAYGIVGDVYTVKILSAPPGLAIACPSTGIIYDTVHAPTGLPVAENNFGFNCSSVTGFDLRAHYISHAGRHAFVGCLMVDNMYCTPQPATLTVNFSDKYDYQSATVAPSTISGHTLTWNFSGLSSGTGTPTFISFSAEKPSLPWYMAGDTAYSSFSLAPFTGDYHPEDNSGDAVDTVKSSFDPNFIEVAPAGCIPSSATDLRYSIGFENTGNDTAFNIFILDTLSSSLDVASLKIVTASAYVTLSKIKYGSQTILKFDFPNINLPDSSHHDLCHGMVVYDIKTKPGLADNTNISNQAGIYFDTNPVVMTNVASNTVNCLTGVHDVQDAGNVTIFPNPASNTLFIKANAGQWNAYTLTNQLGQVLMHGRIAGGEGDVNVSQLPASMYFITISGSTGNIVRKFVKR